MTGQQLEELIHKYAAGIATPEEEELLLRWYRSIPVEPVPWSSSDENERDKVRRRMLHRLQQTLPLRKGRLVRFGALRAAVLLGVVVGTAALIFLLKPAPVNYTTVSNPSGSLRQLRLPDNSTVWLNAATTLRYATNFTAHREVTLDGEAFFEVTHDSSHPFAVTSGRVRTTVLGTRFAIRAYAADSLTSVALLSGKVGVAPEDNRQTVLTPSTQWVWNKATGTAAINRVDTTAVVAWKQGLLRFQGESLGEIIKTLERWYNVRIVLASPGLGRCRYYMSFPNNMPLEQLLSLLSEITQMNYVLDQQTITITGKGCP